MHSTWTITGSLVHKARPIERCILEQRGGGPRLNVTERVSPYPDCLKGWLGSRWSGPDLGFSTFGVSTGDVGRYCPCANPESSLIQCTLPASETNVLDRSVVYREHRGVEIIDTG